MPLFMPPIFQKKCFSIFLTLTVTESPLGLGPRNKMVSHQIDLQILTYSATDLSFWTPSTTVFFLSYSAKYSHIIMMVVHNYYTYFHVNLGTSHFGDRRISSHNWMTRWSLHPGFFLLPCRAEKCIFLKFWLPLYLKYFRIEICNLHFIYNSNIWQKTEYYLDLLFTSVNIKMSIK